MDKHPDRRTGTQSRSPRSQGAQARNTQSRSRHYQTKSPNRLFLILLAVVILAGCTGVTLIVKAMLPKDTPAVQGSIDFDTDSPTGDTKPGGSSQTGHTEPDDPSTSSSPPDQPPDQPPPPVENPNAPRIYLTFDDGPSTVSTPKILDILDQYGVKATFFMLGNQAEYNPDMVRLVESRGHVIANHSYSHDYTAIYQSSDAFMADINRCESVLTSILGHPPVRILRFPAGSAATQLENNPGIRNSIKEQLAAGGWRYFDWNASMGDSWSGGSPQPGELGQALNAYIDEMVAEGYTNIIVLAHDTNSRPWTPADLPMVIEHCQQQGYVFKTLALDSPPCQYR